MLFNLKSIMPEIKTNSQYPFMNEYTAVQDYLGSRPIKTFENLDYWIERTPEAMAIINAIVTDIKSDGFRFEPILKETGKQKENRAKDLINKATHFSKTNFFAEEYFAFLWDWLKYGDAYMWIGGVEQGIKLQEKIDSVGIEIDEDFPRMLKAIPANSVDILHDGKRITGFKQNVTLQPGQPIRYSVNDVIHGKLLPNKGKVYGISPSQAALTEMGVIGYLKDYARTFFVNGGIPDWAIILPNELAGSPNHKRLIEMLQKYKHIQRKHGNLVFTGEVEFEKLGGGLEQLNINDLAIYFTSVLALGHNMPVSRVAALIGSKVRVSTGGDDLANEGYWSKISEHQDRLETWFNTQLWEPYFSVRMRTNRAWKSNEIKEQQRTQFAVNNIITTNNHLVKYDKKLTLEYIKRILYLTDEDLVELTEEEKREKLLEKPKLAGTPLQQDNLANQRGPGTEAYRDEKRKQIPEEQKIQVKSKITLSCDKELFFEKFNRWVKTSGLRNCYYSIKNNNLTAIFSTPDENFKLEVKLNDINPVELNEIKMFGKLIKDFE